MEQRYQNPVLSSRLRSSQRGERIGIKTGVCYLSERKTFSDMHCTVSTYSSIARFNLELIKYANKKIESVCMNLGHHPAGKVSCA